MTLRVSILDQSPVVEGGTAADALSATVDLARSADQWNFTRYWVSEHHDVQRFAGGAPEVLMASLLAQTRRLRIGSGGVLMPCRDPGRVTESFRVLTDLHGARVDLGIGRSRAPVALYAEQIDAVRKQLCTGSGAQPEWWLLGMGALVAGTAARVGAGFCFGHFITPKGSKETLEAYREGFERGPGSPVPRGGLAVNVIVADSAARADRLAEAFLLFRSHDNADSLFPSAETVRWHRWTSAERERAAVHRLSLMSGTAEQVAPALHTLAEEHNVDELVINTVTHDYGERQRSFELLAEALELTAGSERAAGCGTGRGR
ncbi:LLM class flavin-dependent oxidoreductase [Amycolatopsis vastitatis]|uniref:LLM class flavin-dependent oxidoreductase n=1 Tax=Amycolatopsis vastitatis TaxID=1905142 RepID=A0A229TC50_9PSEU|nr:LLM class flavin-dependent oxidoreductase [Amycolatopsis vastitatis]OXM68494.1 LLM class flavin-dependent oxidoreductase [Amycolatopsis vastitatis]